MQGSQVRLAGPFLDNGGQMCGSFLIVEGSRSEVETFAEADPYRIAGLFRSSSIDEWVWAVSRFQTIIQYLDAAADPDTKLTIVRGLVYQLSVGADQSAECIDFRERGCWPHVLAAALHRPAGLPRPAQGALRLSACLPCRPPLARFTRAARVT